MARLNGDRWHSSGSVYGDLIMVNRVREAVGEVMERRAQRAALTANAPSSLSGRMLDGGLADDLDPRRSIFDECGYPSTAAMSPVKWQHLHDRDIVAATVNEVMVRHAWQRPPEIYESEKGKVVTPFERAWKELAGQLRNDGVPDVFADDEGSPVLECLERANALSGIGRFGLIVYGLDDGEGWNKPVPGMLEQGSKPGEIVMDKDGNPVLNAKGQPTVRVDKGNEQRYVLNFASPDNPDLVPATEGRKLRYMNAFPEHMVNVTRWETNKRSPRFGRPVEYQVFFQDPAGSAWSAGVPLSSERVHWSRVQHVVDSTHAYGSSTVLTAPRCLTPLNNILALQKLYHGGPEGFWKHCFPYLFLETHPQLGGDVDVDDEALKDMIEEMMNGLQKAGVMSGMSAKTVGGSIADPTAQVNLHLAAVAMKIRVPMRILTGAITGGLGSTGPADAEYREFNKQVAHYETGYLTPMLLRPCVNFLCWTGILPQPSKPRSAKCAWPDLTKMDAAQLADVAAKRASAMTQYWQGSLAQGMTWHDFLVKELGYDEAEALAIVDNAMGQDQQTHGTGSTELPVTVPEPDDDDGPDDGEVDDQPVERGVGNARMCWGKPCPEGQEIATPEAAAARDKLKAMHEGNDPSTWSYQEIDQLGADLAKGSPAEVRQALADVLGEERGKLKAQLGKSKVGAVRELVRGFKDRLESHQRTSFGRQQ